MFVASTLSRHSLVVALVTGALACSAQSGEGPVGESHDPVVNGTVQNPQGSGVLAVNTSKVPGKPCSGVLLNNAWALSAKHCFASADLATPWSSVVLTMGSEKTTGVFVVPHPTLDVVLVLAYPEFTTASPFPAIVDPRPPSAFVNTNVTCWGYGQSDWVQNIGNGTLRSAVLTVNGAGSDWFTVGPNAAGQGLWHGDSGGPCFSNGALIGITSQGQPIGNTIEVAVSSLLNFFAENVPSFGAPLGPGGPGVDPITGEDYCAAAAADCAARNQPKYMSDAGECQRYQGVPPACSLPPPPKCAAGQHWCAPYQTSTGCRAGYCVAGMAMCMGGGPCDAL